MNKEKELIEEITKWVKKDGIVKMSNHHGSIDRAIVLSYHKTKEKLIAEVERIINSHTIECVILGKKWWMDLDDLKQKIAQLKVKKEW